jgi:hypothetical protein
LAALRDAGVDPVGSDEFREFQQNPCVQEFMGQLRPPDCDGKFLDMMTGVKL